MKVAVVVFPVSTGDEDTLRAYASIVGSNNVGYVWHQETSLEGYDAVALPGGFSYGDHLRAGAIAAKSPIMQAVRVAAEKGYPVLGICNGFQILVEAGLLPGAFRHNDDLRFHCKSVHLRVENKDNPFTREFRPGEVMELPIAHGEGNFYVSDEEEKRLTATGQIVLRYSQADGTVSKQANPNGSVGNIAGILNEKGNVLGMMPHPERNASPLLGNGDGLRLLQSMVGVTR